MKRLAALLFALAASPQIIAALSFFALIAEPAEAQNCGSSNPNCVVPTVTPCLSAPGDQRAVNTAYLNNCGLAGGGTVTSVAAGCGTTTFGSAITSSGVIAAKEPVNAITATSYTIANGDCGTLTTFTNAAAIAVTLPQANTPANVNFIAGWYEDVCSRGAGTATITPTVSTINGATTLPLTSGSCARIVSDGTNYQIVSYGGGGGGGGTPGGATTNVQFNNAGSFAGDSGFTYAAGTGQAKLVRSGGPIGTGTIFSTINNSSGIANGQVLVGGLNYVDVQGASTIFEVVSDSNPFQAAFITADATALAGSTVYAKTRAAQPTGNTIVNSGDQIMLIAGMGNDGTGYKQAFQLLGVVDSAPGASSMPGRLSFLTSPSGSTTPAERLRIDSTGLTTIFGNVTMSGLGAGTQTKCLGLTAGNAVVPSASACGGALTVGTTTVSGGAAGNMLYTDGALLQATGGITFVGTGQEALALGTITTNLKAINITGTFNNAATTFDAPIFVNITNTASQTGSVLIDLQTGGVPNFIVRPDTFFLALGAATWQFGGTPDVAAPVAQTVQVQNVVAGTTNTAGAPWTFNGSKGTGSADGGTIVFQLAPKGNSGTSQNPLLHSFEYGIRDIGVNDNVPQFSIYSQFTNASNYSRLAYYVDITNASAVMQSENAGTGTATDIAFASATGNILIAKANVANFLNMSFTNLAAAFASNWKLGFASGTTIINTTAPDTAIARNGAGILEIDNGTAGTFRDLSLRHMRGNGAPTANSCAGFALSAGSSDLAGRITYTSATTCSITFAAAFTNAPFCVITPEALATTQIATLTTGFTATFGAAQTAFQYACFGL